MKKVLKNNRKNLKLTMLGFTLIELLAVIIILAIIVVIATPIINNVIEDSKESANQRSIEGYAKAIKNEYYNQQATGIIPVIDEEFLSKVDTSGNEITCDSVSHTDEYGVVLYNCIIAEDTSKKYCYANDKHYQCDDNEYLTILADSSEDTSSSN